MLSTKDFYLVVLICLTASYGTVFLLLWNHYKNKLGSNRLLLFVSLAFFSWTLVGLYKFSGPEYASVVHAVSDRVLSSLSNLFLIAALTYFPGVFSTFKSRFPWFANPDKWVLAVLFFFIGITILFTSIERMFFDNQLLLNAIIVIDSLISTATILLVSYALVKNILQLWNSKPLLYFLVFLVTLFVLSQIYLPACLVVGGALRDYYSFGLIALLLGINTLGLLTLSFFGVYQLQSVRHLLVDSKFDGHVPQTIEEKVKLMAVEVGYDESEKHYFISMTFESPINKQQYVESVTLSKLLKPFANWVSFVIARSVNAKLGHDDIAIIKFRMVQLWNKYADTKLTQDDLFHNDLGRFELKVSSDYVALSNEKFLHSRYLIRSSFEEFKSLFSENDKNAIAEKFPEFRKSV